jgi:hypothetical protein
MPILTNRWKTEMVLAQNVTNREDHGQVERMLFPLDVFRALFCDDLEICCGFVYQDDNDEDLVHHANTLPSDNAVACLLHPLVGGMLYFVLLGKNKTLLYLTFWHVFDCLNVLAG